MDGPRKLNKWQFVGTVLGPGLIYAGASIGTSHLVQATRAGAMAGLGLLGVVLLALLLKFPFFEFGSRYSSATGKDLVHGYREIGIWALLLFLSATLLTGGFAGVALIRFTAILFAFVFGGSENLMAWVVGLSSAVVALIYFGGYRLLDKTMKSVLVVLAVSTVAATLASTPLIDIQTIRLVPMMEGNLIVPLAFLLALVGWMPAPIEVSAWYSLWAVAKYRESDRVPSVSEARLDLMIGYFGSGFLALCFLALGAAVMYGAAIPLSNKGSVFSTQLVEMYSMTLGGWARPLVIVAVLTTMLSTILAVMDAVPRTISAAVSSLRGSDLNGKDGKDTIFVASLLGLGVFSIFGNAVFVGSFTIIIDAATIVAFLTAPVLAMLNLRLVTSESMPEEHRPSTAMRVYASLGIGLSVLFSFYYFAYRLSF